MDEPLYVKPEPGRRVRDPASRQVLPDAGQLVPPTSFWRRRIADGDVRVTQRPDAPDPDGKITKLPKRQQD